ncbi:hypothetical protein GCM10009688_03540 [Arthrobacter gandavensis]|uniref:Uncharacterized protein n=1 Tax=Arthrobacter gandavensis TaxID=169960 RepID=A0ABN2NUX4_9MICC|nr:hypothetical protein [Arthrobacter citreus]
MKRSIDQDFPEVVPDHYNTTWVAGGLSYAGEYLGPDDHSPFPVYVSMHHHGDRSKQGNEGGVDPADVPHLDTHPARFSESCTEEDKARISRYIYLSMTRMPHDGGWDYSVRIDFKMNRDWNDVVGLVNQYLPEGYVLDNYWVGL